MERPCGDCRRSFASVEELREHRRELHSLQFGPPGFCAFCSRGFDNKFQFYDHLLETHPERWKAMEQAVLATCGMYLEYMESHIYFAEKAYRAKRSECARTSIADMVAEVMEEQGFEKLEDSQKASQRGDKAVLAEEQEAREIGRDAVDAGNESDADSDDDCGLRIVEDEEEEEVLDRGGDKPVEPKEEQIVSQAPPPAVGAFRIQSLLQALANGEVGMDKLQLLGFPEQAAATQPQEVYTPSSLDLPAPRLNSSYEEAVTQSGTPLHTTPSENITETRCVGLSLEMPQGSGAVKSAHKSVSTTPSTLMTPPADNTPSAITVPRPNKLPAFAHTADLTPHMGRMEIDTTRKRGFTDEATLSVIRFTEGLAELGTAKKKPRSLIEEHQAARDTPLLSPPPRPPSVEIIRVVEPAPALSKGAPKEEPKKSNYSTIAIDPVMYIASDEALGAAMTPEMIEEAKRVAKEEYYGAVDVQVPKLTPAEEALLDAWTGSHHTPMIAAQSGVLLTPDSSHCSDATFPYIEDKKKKQEQISPSASSSGSMFTGVSEEEHFKALSADPAHAAFAEMGFDVMKSPGSLVNAEQKDGGSSSTLPSQAALLQQQQQRDEEAVRLHNRAQLLLEQHKRQQAVQLGQGQAQGMMQQKEMGPALRKTPTLDRFWQAQSSSAQRTQPHVTAPPLSPTGGVALPAPPSMVSTPQLQYPQQQQAVPRSSTLAAHQERHMIQVVQRQICEFRKTEEAAVCPLCKLIVEGKIRKRAHVTKLHYDWHFFAMQYERSGNRAAALDLFVGRTLGFRGAGPRACSKQCPDAARGTTFSTRGNLFAHLKECSPEAFDAFIAEYLRLKAQGGQVLDADFDATIRMLTERV